MAGKHEGMDDDRFLPFLDVVRILNFLQNHQMAQPVYVLENTWPGFPGQYPKVDDASKMVEAYLGLPIIIDAARVGSISHRVRHIWTNLTRPKVLQAAFPIDILPSPTLSDVLGTNIVATVPSVAPRYPFVPHNQVGKPRICMPTIVSYPNNHAYRFKESSAPGEGQYWNKDRRTWQEPTLAHMEQMLGYPIGFTDGGLATDTQRAVRLGHAVDGNTLRWFGAFLRAAQSLP